MILKKNKKIFALLVLTIGPLICCESSKERNISSVESELQSIAFSEIHIQEELLQRAHRNYDRLEDEIYQPKNVFQAGGASEGWPGDKEGRIILGLTLQAQATGREPKYLKEIIDMIPEYVNEKGYLGPILKDSVMEQQLSGHGWLLRGLCEYYTWKQDPEVKKHIENIIQNLALPTRGKHSSYPIDPSSRKEDVGEAAGTTQNTMGVWQLSSDIGCNFIFLDGLVQAYDLFPSPELKELIDEMNSRFFEMDLVEIKAQTHATLTGLRGILRYYEITKDPVLLEKVEKRYQLYRELAMTENYENFNWFGRPEWTEPCAIIDSYMLAVQLWQFNKNPVYLEDAQHIYYNAISHTQRSNGGFGLDNCPGPNGDFLKVEANEAFWCCTMRGGEGLAKAIQYSYFSNSNSLFVPFFNSSEATLEFNGKEVVLKQSTDYPFEGKVSFEVLESEAKEDIEIHLFAPSWTENHQIKVNGKQVTLKDDRGFITYHSKLEKGAQTELSFDIKSGVHPVINDSYTPEEKFSLHYGPLLLGYEGDKKIAFETSPDLSRQGRNIWTTGNRNTVLTPIYHLLDEKVWEGTGYQKQILFSTKE